MAIAYVKDTGHQTGNGVDSDGGSFGTLPIEGNAVIVFISIWQNDVAAGEVTDNQGVGNTYTQDKWLGPGTHPNNASGGIFADTNIGATSGTFTVTVSPSNAGDYFEWAAAEFSGLADTSALDITASATGTNQTPIVTGGTTNQASELWCGVLSANDVDESTALGLDFPAGWSQVGNIIQDPGTTIAFMAGYKIVSSTGTLTFDGGTIRAASDGWVVCAAAYKEAAAVDNVYRFQQGVILQAIKRGAFF